MKLYSAWYCPFAQRAWLALLVKRAKFEYVEIDPYQKTDEWMKISRQTGQVPVLALSDKKAVVDSSRVVEFVDHAITDRSQLFAPDSFENAEQKYWIDHINKKIIPNFYRFLKNADYSEPDSRAKKNMLNGLEQLTLAMDNEGPFFSGENINSVDIALIPFAYRINLLLKHYRHFSLPTCTRLWRRYHQWYQTNIEQPEFQQTLNQQTRTEKLSNHRSYQQRLIEFYLPYSLGGGQADVTD